MAIIPIHTDILKDLFNQSSKIQKNDRFVQCFKLFGKGSIPFSEGEQWKRKRRIISSIFHFDFLNHMIPVIEEQTNIEFKKIDKQIQDGKTVNLMNSFTRILSTVIIKCFFGTDVSQYSVNGQSFEEFYIEFLNQISLYSQSFQQLIFGLTFYKYGLSKRGRQLKKKVQILHTISKQIVQKQLVVLKNKGFAQKNLLTTLYENNMLNQTDTYNPEKYTKEQLIAQFFSFFAAGTDTTANTINVILHYLSDHKEYVEKIQNQLQQIKSLEGPQKLKKMKWMDACIDQSLRISGPTPFLFPRVTTEKISAGGLQIPKQTAMNIFTLINNYKSQYYQRPFQYKPERWIEGLKAPPFSFLPFSAGQRNCIGQYLSKIEAKTLLMRIIQKYQFKAKYPIKMSFEFVYFNKNAQFEMKIKNSKI